MNGRKFTVPVLCLAICAIFVIGCSAVDSTTVEATSVGLDAQAVQNADAADCAAACEAKKAECSAAKKAECAAAKKAECSSKAKKECSGSKTDT